MKLEQPTKSDEITLGEIETRKKELKQKDTELKAKKELEELLKKEKTEGRAKEVPKVEGPKLTLKTIEAELQMLYERKLALNKEQSKLDEEIRKVEHQKNGFLGKK